MADYIDRDALNWWDDLFMKGVNNSGVWVRYKDVEHFIKDAPAVDAVPVVRCRECVLHDKCSTEDVFKFAVLSENKRFCGVGKRREEET